MKALSSFSSPSSGNGREILSGSRNRTSAGCIPRILRRILCFSSLSTRPFDYLKEEEELLHSSMVVGSSGTTPGIVARLMGLESFPLTEGIPSTNSCDSFKKLKSPRVKRGLIIPITYQEDEDENFFIFRFESHFERRKSGKNYERMEQSTGAKYKKKKKSMIIGDSMQERDNKENMVSKQNLLDGVVCNKSDFQVENGSNVLRPLKDSSQKIKKKQAKVNFETEGDSQISSPNSVLEFAEFPTDQQASCSENVSRLANPRMRRTLSEELEKCEASKEKRLLINGYGGKWDEIGTEVMKVSWVQHEIWRNQNHFKEIGGDLASQILDQLLDELLSNLINF